MMLLLLFGVALVGIQPWAANSVDPRLDVPGLGAVSIPETIAAAPAPAAAAAAPRVGRAHAMTVAAPARAPEQSSSPQAGIGPGRPVAGGGSAAPEPAPTPPSPQAQAQPEPVVAQEPAPPPVPAAAPAPGPQLVADFEDGLNGFSTSAVGDVPPRVASGIARDGERAGLIRLTGAESSSGLILGGDGGSGEEGIVEIRDGQEYAFAFSFYIQSMVYGEPGADNMILRLRSDASESVALGLELWEAPGQTAGFERGLWSSGEAVGGDRFLAPVSERAWHDVVVQFKASSQGLGSYALYLDRELVDSRDGVSLIAPGSDHSQIEVGLFRDGERVQGTSEIRLDAAKLGETLESVQP
jgi:hypothetical protein